MTLVLFLIARKSGGGRVCPFCWFEWKECND